MGCCDSKMSDYHDKPTLLWVHDFPVVYAGSADVSSKPQRVIGRICLAPGTEPLLTPIYRRPCVAYRALVEEFDTTTHQWNKVVEEFLCQNFFLCNPYNARTVFIPGAVTNMKDYGMKSQSILHQDRGVTPTIRTLLDRYGANNENVYRQFRIRESYFENGDALVILASIQIRDGVVLAAPVFKADGYLNKTKWSAQDNSTWMELSESPAVVMTDYPATFGGYNVPYITSPPVIPAIPNPGQYEGKGLPEPPMKTSEPSNLPHAVAVNADDVKSMDDVPHDNLTQTVDRAYTGQQAVHHVAERDIPISNAATGFNTTTYNPYGVASVGFDQPAYEAPAATEPRTVRIQVPLTAAPGAFFNMVNPDTGVTTRVQLPLTATPGSYVDIVIH